MHRTRLERGEGHGAVKLIGGGFAGFIVAQRRNRRQSKRIRALRFEFQALALRASLGSKGLKKPVITSQTIIGSKKRQFARLLGWLTGLEPATAWTTTRSSTN
jgi:hypothetical protein